jgi:hypothetical protein
MCIVCIPSFVPFDPIEKGCSFELDHLIPLVQVQCREEIGNTDICVKAYQSLSLSLFHRYRSDSSCTSIY